MKSETSIINCRRVATKLSIVLSLLLTGVAAVWWLFLGENPVIGNDADKFPIRGVDISAHNGDIDFMRLRDKGRVEFVFIKATEGAQWKDRRFRSNFRRARRAGIRTGAYHFFRFDVDGDLQALNILSALNGLTPDLPVAIDVEQHSNPSDIPIDTVVTRLTSMIDHLQARRVNTIIYTDRRTSYIVARLPKSKRSHIWFCSLGPTAPLRDWTFWQHSHRGSLPGTDHAIDLNVFAGDSAGWRAWQLRNPYRLP